MKKMTLNNKILIVDDNPSIHQDFKNALVTRISQPTEAVLKLEKEIFGSNSQPNYQHLQFELQHAFSTEDALKILEKSHFEQNPIAVIFMDIKMPPGMDGIAASKIILDKFPHTEIVLCTAFTEYTHEEILIKLGLTDHIIFLKKPFDIVEVRQLAIALMQKWNLNREVEKYTNRLETEVKKRTFELEKALEQAKKADLAKSNFLSLMSHEIRNPINSIIGLIDLIQKSKEQADKDNLMILAQKATTTLLELVNDVLDLSKIEANRLVIENNTFELSQLVEHLITHFSIPIYNKNLEFKALYPIKLPKMIYGDIARIKQILMNFITNAIKFTPSGSISLIIIYHRIDEAKGSFIFKIIDTGIGISEKDQKRLFSDYTQISDGLPYNILGTGLGLSITKKIATLMGATVNVQSKKDKGSTFSLEIPLQISSEEFSTFPEIDLTRIGILVISKSISTRSFFDYYAKELNIEKNIKIIQEQNDVYTLTKSFKEPLEEVHVFHDVEDSLSNQTITLIASLAKAKPFIHSIVPFLYKPKISLQSAFTLNTITRPLIVKDFYNLLSHRSAYLPNVNNNNSEAFDLELQKKIKNCKILLVDDDSMALLITSTNLKNWGFYVDQAESGEIALQYHKKFNYDIIFMDLMLNGSNGIEATKKIRSLKAPLNQVHIVALTANAFAEDKERCLKGGMNDFFTKPMPPNAIHDYLLNFIHKKQNIMTNPPEQIVAKSTNSINENIYHFLFNTYGFKDDQLQNIINVSKKSLQATLSETENSVKNNDLRLSQILFHRLKGSLKNLGLNDASNWARKIELEIESEKKLTNSKECLENLKSYLSPFINS